MTEVVRVAGRTDDGSDGVTAYSGDRDLQANNV